MRKHLYHEPQGEKARDVKVTHEESIQSVGSSSTVEYYPIFGPHLAREKLVVFVTEEDGEADHSLQMNSLQVVGKQAGSN